MTSSPAIARSADAAALCIAFAIAVAASQAAAAEAVDAGAAPAMAASAAATGASAPSAGLGAPRKVPTEAIDYAVPALEILGFDFLVNRLNYHFGSPKEDYAVTADSIRRNLRSGWSSDRDPFDINQLGHPYQGSMYHGFARSAGFN